MSTDEYSNLFFTCSLIEYIGRQLHLQRSNIIDSLGKNIIKRIYDNAQTLHCEPIAKVADDVIEEAHLQAGTYENTADRCSTYPDYWAIGAVYARLVEDFSEDKDAVDILFQVYHSWITEFIDNYNLPIYYQSRNYLAACYEEGKILN